ncbi:MAG: hypothetical protein KF686_04780 [Ramlibacter sp.]|nr:hypothetical protein [Ramlibacter sp.]
MMKRVAATFIFAGLLYALGLMTSMFNQYFDRSEVHIERASVIENRERLMPFPVRVLTLQSDSGSRFNLDVPTELADKTAIGDRLDIVRSKGWLGKSWRMDKDFYIEIHGDRTRTIQGLIYVAMALVLSVCWFGLARKILPRASHAALSVLLAYLAAYAIFWIMP